jgi:hypothetical protein
MCQTDERWCGLYGHAAILNVFLRRWLPMGRTLVARAVTTCQYAIMDHSGRSLIVVRGERSHARMFQVMLDGAPEREIPLDSSLPLYGVHGGFFTSGSMDAKGRLIVTLSPLDFVVQPARHSGYSHRPHHATPSRELERSPLRRVDPRRPHSRKSGCHARYHLEVSAACQVATLKSQIGTSADPLGCDRRRRRMAIARTLSRANGEARPPIRAKT